MFGAMYQAIFRKTSVLAILFLLILPIILPSSNAIALENSKDDIYLKAYYDGYKVPYKARFVLSDFGGKDMPYHAYYADPDSGYVRYEDPNAPKIQSTKEYVKHDAQFDPVPTEQFATLRTVDGGVRSTFYYPRDKYSNSYLIDVMNSMDYSDKKQLLSYEQNIRPTYKEVFRNEYPQRTALVKKGTTTLAEIPDINEYIQKKRPEYIYNKPDDYYYNPSDRTTLRRPYIYYKLEERRYTDCKEIDYDG